MEEERRGEWRGEKEQSGGWSHKRQMHSLFVPYGIWVHLLGHQPLYKSVGVFRRPAPGQVLTVSNVGDWITHQRVQVQAKPSPDRNASSGVSSLR